MESLLDEIENVLDSYKDTDVKGDHDEMEEKDITDADENGSSAEINFSAFKIFSCTKCSLRTNSEAVLLLHMEGNQHKTWLKEDNDDHKMKQPFTIIKRKKIAKPVTKRGAISVKKCSFCEEEVFSAGALREHMKKHPGKTIFSCSEPGCDYGTNYSGNLRLIN